MYRVVVTYGTVRNATYACAPTKENAERLMATARTLGYDDARVLSEEEYATLFPENAATDRRGSAGSARSYPKAR